MTTSTRRLSIADAADHLGVSPITVRRRIKAEDLQAEQEPTAQGYQWRVLLEIPDEVSIPTPSEDGVQRQREVA